MNYFGTDGIRGIANEFLTPELAFKLGRVAGYIMSKGKPGEVIIARDTRISGSMLESAVAAGFNSVGLDTLMLGIIPTPALAYLIGEYKTLGGVMISASHNPYEYNGIKIFDKDSYKLTEDEEKEIERYLDSPEDIDYRPLAKDLGKSIYLDEGSEKYIDYLTSRYDLDLKGMTIALDCGNGALYKIGRECIERLGARVEAINEEPNGFNINDNCGSTNPQMISDFTIKVGADLGLSFDGDGDRLIVADERGQILNGDHILYILAKYLNKKGRLKNKTVVGTVMTNMGLDDGLEVEGIHLLKTKVGDKYILEKMINEDYSLGGEQSGHIINLDVNTTGDGLASGLALLEVMKDSGKSLSQLDQMSDYPQVLVNVKVDEAKINKLLEDKDIVNLIERVENELGDKGRVLIRKSGTEPLIRVMIEAKGISDIEDRANKIGKLIKERGN